jgi:hypothetical protein
MLKIIASEQVVNPGIYELSSEAYHKGLGISRSGLMEFKRSPYHYWYKYLNPEYIPEPSTPAQTFGNALHSYVLEPESFAERYFVIPKFNKRTKLGTERWQLMKLEIGHREILSEAQWQTLQAMADSLRKNKLVLQLLESAQIEKSLYWTDPDTGILCKCRPDILRSNLVCDLKTAQDGSPRSFQYALFDYGYHIQAAMIREALQQLKQSLLNDFLFLVIEKSAPYAISIYQLDQVALDKGHQEFKTLLTRYQHCLETNDWPAYAIQEISLPRYAFN